MRRAIMIFVGMVVLFSASAMVDAYSSGPPDGRTGAPGEDDCTTNCHNSYPVNSGDGSLAIEGLPSSYNPDSLYTITVTLENPGQERWGFEVTVLDSSNIHGGLLLVTDSTNTQQSITSSGRVYIKHTSTGTYDGTADGPVSWSFDWITPEPGTGTVTFYAAGNAANSGTGNKLDYIYTTSASSEEGVGDPTNQPPTCTISSPSSGAKLSGTATISGTASDTEGTVEHVEIKVDSGNWNQATGTTSWSYNLDTTGLSNGNHTVSARAYDGQSYSSEASVNIEVDNAGEDDGKSDDGGSSLLILIVLIVIMVIIIVAVVLMRGRK